MAASIDFAGVGGNYSTVHGSATIHWCLRDQPINSTVFTYDWTYPPHNVQRDNFGENADWVHCVFNLTCNGQYMTVLVQFVNYTEYWWRANFTGGDWRWEGSLNQSSWLYNSGGWDQRRAISAWGGGLQTIKWDVEICNFNPSELGELKGQFN